MVRTPPFHGGNTSSSLVGVTISQIMIKFLEKKFEKILGIGSFRQLKRFLITGGISTLISYSTFITSLHIFNTHYILANFTAFIISIIFGYNCNKRWSFGGDHHKSSHIIEYLAIYISSSLILSTIILKITIDYIGIIPEIAYIFSLCITTCINFLGTKFLVFKK